MLSVVNMLQTLGADALDATRFAARISRPKHRTTVVEVYGTGNLVRLSHGRMRNLNVAGLNAFDLRTQKPNGEPWDFRKRSDRQMAYRYIREHCPGWLIGSPPCTPFSQWNLGVNKKKMDPQTYAANLAEGRMHMRFMVSLYRLQVSSGRFCFACAPCRCRAGDRR